MLTFSNGAEYSMIISDADWDFIASNQNNEKAIAEYFNLFDLSFNERIENSNLLEFSGSYVCMPSVSKISIPKDFVIKILDAEESGDSVEINKWTNFWRLVSLNPDSRVRDNIFWFIRRWDIDITDSGMLVTYRNAVLKDCKYTTSFVKETIMRYYEEKYINHKDPKEIIVENSNTNLQDLYNDVVDNNSPVFTDAHSYSTTIKLGKPVRMPREKCDCDSNISCSAGLHTAAQGWLQRNYFGDTGLQCLVNPMNVTAIPVIDNYGKLRSCEYLPVAIVSFDENGELVVPKIPLYNDINYLKDIVHEEIEVNNEDLSPYMVRTEDRESIYNSILQTLQ